MYDMYVATVCMNISGIYGPLDPYFRLNHLWCPLKSDDTSGIGDVKWVAHEDVVVCFSAIRQHAIIWTNVDTDLCRQMASLGHNELMILTEHISLHIQLQAILKWSMILFKWMETNTCVYFTHTYMWDKKGAYVG